MSAASNTRPQKCLHVFVTNLDSSDATLRALDVAQHLITHGRRAVHLVSAADGPLKTAFAAAGATVSIRPGGPAAGGVGTASVAPAHALAVFGHPSAQAQLYARELGVPTLVDEKLIGNGSSPLWFDPKASLSMRPEIRGKLDLSDQDRVAFVYTAPAETASLPALVMKTLSWLGRPEIPVWRLMLIEPDGGIREMRTSSVGRRFDAGAQSWESAADAVIRLRTDEDGVRPLLNASALALPVVTTPSPALGAVLPTSFVRLISPDTPQELAHALIDLAANPGATARRVASAHWHVMTHHHPATGIPRWMEALDSVLGG